MRPYFPATGSGGGAAGPPGPTGATGPQGVPGPAGSTLYVESAAPADNSVGEDGDTWLVDADGVGTVDGELWRKQAGSWVLRTDLIVDGVAGDGEGTTYSSAVPSNATGEDGDQHVITAAEGTAAGDLWVGDTYERQSGVWVRVLRGPDLSARLPLSRMPAEAIHIEIPYCQDPAAPSNPGSGRTKILVLEPFDIVRVRVVIDDDVAAEDVAAAVLGPMSLTISHLVRPDDDSGTSEAGLQLVANNVALGGLAASVVHTLTIANGSVAAGREVVIDWSGITYVTPSSGYVRHFVNVYIDVEYQ